MTNVESVEIIKRWVFDDLSNYDPPEQREVVDGLEDVEEKIETWNRDFHQMMSPLKGTSQETIYRQRIGDFRAYYVRQGDTLTVGCKPMTEFRTTWRKYSQIVTADSNCTASESVLERGPMTAIWTE
jgi:mRNA-degrading endonuclease RelE of RelBE toxin-antitoxin system